MARRPLQVDEDAVSRPVDDLRRDAILPTSTKDLLPQRRHEERSRYPGPGDAKELAPSRHPPIKESPKSAAPCGPMRSPLELPRFLPVSHLLVLTHSHLLPFLFVMLSCPISS